MKRLSCAFLICILLLVSCGYDNIYTAWGLIDPVQSLSDSVSYMTVEDGSVNLLSLVHDSEGSLTYASNELEGRIIRAQSPDKTSRMIETLRYLRDTGKLDEYLKSPLEPEVLEVMKNSCRFCSLVITDVKGLVERLSLDIETIEEIPVEIKDVIRNASVPLGEMSSWFENMSEFTSEDYVAIQTGMNLIAGTVDVIYSAAATAGITVDNLDELMNSMDADFIRQVSPQLESFAGTVLDILAMVDQVGRYIDKLPSVSEMIGAVMK